MTWEFSTGFEPVEGWPDTLTVIGVKICGWCFWTNQEIPDPTVLAGMVATVDQWHEVGLYMDLVGDGTALYAAEIEVDGSRHVIPLQRTTCNACDREWYEPRRPEHPEGSE